MCVAGGRVEDGFWVWVRIGGKEEDGVEVGDDMVMTEVEQRVLACWPRTLTAAGLQPHSWQPGIQNPYRGTVVWMVPENVDVSVTLYRVSFWLDG